MNTNYEIAGASSSSVSVLPGFNRHGVETRSIGVDTFFGKAICEIIQNAVREPEQLLQPLNARSLVSVGPQNLNDNKPPTSSSHISSFISGAMRLLDSLKMKANQHLRPNAANTSLLKHRLNPMIYEEALKILDLSVEIAESPSAVDEAYTVLIDILSKKQTYASPVIAHEIGILLQDIQIAYRTIKKQGNKL